MKIIKTKFLYLLIVIVLSGFLTCCDDCPTCPESNDEYFYVAGRIGDGHSLIKMFSIEQQKFVDSIVTLDLEIRDMGVINNEYLLAAGDWMLTYDISKRNQVSSIYPFRSYVEVSNDNKYLVSMDQVTRHWIIYDIEKGETLFSDRASGGDGCFSSDSRYFINPMDTNKIIFYDLLKDSVTKEIRVTLNEEPLWVYKLWYVDESKIYAITAGAALFLCSIDTETGDAEIIRAPLNTHGEYGCFSPDHSLFYFVNTPYTDYEFPQWKVELYNTSTDQLTDSISTRDYRFEPRGLAISQDGQYMMLVPYVLGSHPWEVMLISVPDKQILGLYDFGYLYNPEIVR